MDAILPRYLGTISLHVTPSKKNSSIIIKVIKLQ